CLKNLLLSRGICHSVGLGACADLGAMLTPLPLVPSNAVEAFRELSTPPRRSREPQAPLPASQKREGNRRAVGKTCRSRCANLCSSLARLFGGNGGLPCC